MNILQRIKSDHETQRALMKAIVETSGDTEERQMLYATFLKEYTAHAAAEEHAFYAELMKKPETTDQSRHSVAEHQEALEIIEKLNETDMSSPAWLALFKKLSHENEHHMSEEEDDVFPLAEEHLEAGRLDELASVFDSRKDFETA